MRRTALENYLCALVRISEVMESWEFRFFLEIKKNVSSNPSFFLPLLIQLLVLAYRGSSEKDISAAS